MEASIAKGSGNPLLAIEDVVVRFDMPYTIADRIVGQPRRVVHALNAVRLDIRRGETIGIVGESGCGKSTLARTIVRLIEPDDGHIRFEGVDIATLRGRDRRNFNRRIQMIFQDPFGSLNPRMTVRQMLREALSVHRMRPFNIPSGCAFHNRCPQAFERCSKEKPVLSPRTPSHHAACFLTDFGASVP